VSDGSFSLKRQSLADQVADAVLAMIVEQQISPGESLPSTGDLAERFSVSRTVIREALADLAGRGMIERSQGRESIVSSPGPEQLQELLRFRVQREGIDSEAIMEFRQSMEVQAAGLAAVRRTDTQIDAIRMAWDQLSAAKTETEFHDADIAFHTAVAAASGNPLISLVLDALVDLLRDVRKRSYRGRRKKGTSLEAVIADHRAIYDAIESGDATAAEHAMKAHLSSTVGDLRAS
jgi:GntR family transcriptional regulator, transcriptional repressor for pyruvate dehydrogenase complex